MQWGLPLNVVGYQIIKKEGDSRLMAHHANLLYYTALTQVSSLTACSSVSRLFLWLPHLQLCAKVVEQEAM